MRIVVLPEAADEFEDATDYYEQQQPGLGDRFRDEVDRHIRWLSGHAELSRLRPGGYRRVNLKLRSDRLARWTQTQVTFERIASHSCIG